MINILDFLENDEAALDRLAMKTYDESGNIITEWDEEKGWFEDGTEQNSYGEWIMTRIYHPYTEEQLAEIQIEKEKAALAESRRQLTLDEVAAFFIRSQLNTVDIPDQTSLRMINYYPTFDEIVGTEVKKGFKFTYKGKMYKTEQPTLTIQKEYPPEKGTESLYSRIDLEHLGTVYDPIPYEGNMEIYKDKYYIQNDVLYICTRDSGIALVHSLSDLVGTYVELVNQQTDKDTETEIQDDYPEWKQPTGAHDAYTKGYKITYKDKKYISLIDANTYSPEAYPAGWQEVVE